MNEHTRVSALLAQYVSGALDDDQRRMVEQHLFACLECKADLALWETVAEELAADNQLLAAPRRLDERALSEVRTRKQHKPGLPVQFSSLLLLLRTQAPMVQREIWLASAAVIALGYVAAWVAAHSGFVYNLAPLIAAACVSMIYGPDNDPNYELSLSTPTSPRQVLLARLVLVFGYNLGLVIVAMLGLLPLFDKPILADLVTVWLAPMTFLTAAALVLSLWIGATNAISVTYVAWLGKVFDGFVIIPFGDLSSLAMKFLDAYRAFWQTPTLLLGLSAGLFALAIWMAGRHGRGLAEPV